MNEETESIPLQTLELKLREIESLWSETKQHNGEPLQVTPSNGEEPFTATARSSSCFMPTPICPTPPRTPPTKSPPRHYSREASSRRTVSEAGNTSRQSSQVCLAPCTPPGGQLLSAAPSLRSSQQSLPVVVPTEPNCSSTAPLTHTSSEEPLVLPSVVAFNHMTDSSQDECRGCGSRAPRPGARFCAQCGRRLSLTKV